MANEFQGGEIPSHQLDTREATKVLDALGEVVSRPTNDPTVIDDLGSTVELPRPNDSPNEVLQEPSTQSERPIDLSGISGRSNASDEMEKDNRRRDLENVMGVGMGPLTSVEAAELRSTNPVRKNPLHRQNGGRSVLRTLGVLTKNAVVGATTLLQRTKNQAPKKEITSKETTDDELAASIRLNTIPGQTSRREPWIDDSDQHFPDRPMPDFSNIWAPVENVGPEDFSRILHRPVDNTNESTPTLLNHPFGSSLFRAGELGRGLTRRGDSAEDVARREKISAHSHKVLTSSQADIPEPEVTPPHYPLTQHIEVPLIVEERTPFVNTINISGPDLTPKHDDHPLLVVGDNPPTLSFGESVALDISGERRAKLREPPQDFPEILSSTISPLLTKEGGDPARATTRPKNGTVKRGLFSGFGRMIKIGLNRLTSSSDAPKITEAPKIMDMEFAAESGLTFDEVAKIERANAAINTIHNKTETIRRTLLEQVGNGVRKNILNKIEKFGEKFNKIPLKYRLGVGLGIAALGATGAPFVLPTLALATMFRAASGAGTYALLHELLEKNYRGIESRGGKVSFLRKGVMEAGALTVATFGSYYLSQYIGSIWQDLFENGHNFTPHTPAAAPDITTPTQPEITPTVQQVPDVATSNLPTQAEVPVVATSLPHTILPNERLWDVVKNHLLESGAFKNLPVEAKNIEISKYIAYIDQQKILPNVNLVQAGQVIDFSKVDGKVPADILKYVNPFSH